MPGGVLLPDLRLISLTPAGLGPWEWVGAAAPGIAPKLGPRPETLKDVAL